MLSISPSPRHSPVTYPNKTEGHPVTVLLKSLLQNFNKSSPTGWRYQTEDFGLAVLLNAWLGDACYDKIATFYSGSLPVSRTLASKFSYSPALEGFQVEHFAKMKIVWTAEIALLLKTTKEEAAALLAESPFVTLAQDETVVRPAFGYIQSHDHIIGPVHDNVTHTFKPFRAADFPLRSAPVLAEKVDCFVLKLLRFPSVPAWLLAIIPTSNSEVGNAESNCQESLPEIRPKSLLTWPPHYKSCAGSDWSPTAAMELASQFKGNCGLD